jgi:hypothetical protein
MDSIIGPETVLRFLSESESKEESTTGLEADIVSMSITKPETRYPGLAEAHRQIMEVLMYPVLYPDLIAHLNLDCPKGTRLLWN